VMHARMLAFAGRAHLGLQTLRAMTIGAFSDNPLPSCYVQLAEAEISDMLGDYAGAAVSATNSALGYQEAGSERGFRMAMVMLAVVQEDLGNRVLAIQSARQALEPLANMNPHFLMAGLSCLARLTGKRAHRDAVKEIRALITT
ncbi:MAG: hypothetical protein M3Z14_03945, partial [Candidatus Eremiobacteraeota bacterium]|nr:hypothetical protein [Candidatus Eremiobacteraeota bacterium]